MVYIHVEKGTGFEKEDRVSHADYRHIDAAFDIVSQPFVVYVASTDRTVRGAIRATQQQLPNSLRIAFQQTLRPELIAVLQESLPPLNSTLLENYQELQNTTHEIFVIKWNENYEDLSTVVKEIKEDIKSSKVMQTRIESCLRGVMPRGRQIALPAAGQKCLDSVENEESISQISNTAREPLIPNRAHGSLIEM